MSCTTAGFSEKLAFSHFGSYIEKQKQFNQHFPFSLRFFGSKLEGGKPAEETTKYWVETSKAAYPPFPSKTISCQNMASINLKVPAAKKWGVEEGRDTFFRKPLAWGGADRGREKEKEIGDIGLQKKERRRRKRRGKK